jgi:hypothetical protein
VDGAGLSVFVGFRFLGVLDEARLSVRLKVRVEEAGQKVYFHIIFPPETSGESSESMITVTSSSSVEVHGGGLSGPSSLTNCKASFVS